MAEVINLRRARKAKARKTAESQAAENRRVHGLSKAEKTLEAARRKLAAEQLDSARLDEPTPSPED